MTLIFFVRLITATFLFAFLGKANIWLNPLANLTLAVGYRTLLVFSPIVSRYSGKYAVPLTLLLSVIGTILFVSNHNGIMVVGTILVGLGFSVSGYLIKAQASETPRGAASNKIALNCGSLIAGLILLIEFGSKQTFFFSAAVVLFFAALVSLSNLKSFEIKPAIQLNQLSDNRNFSGWAFVGISIGIKLFAVFSVLPQYLIEKTGDLPEWYGLIILLNSLVVIFLQLPIINFIDRFSGGNIGFKLTLICMITGMIIIAFPQAFYAQYFAGAMIWTLLLSIVECSASYLDVQGSRSGFLFIKEIFVGIGGGLTVWVTRYLEPGIASVSLGGIGILVILLATGLLYKDMKGSKLLAT